MSEAAVADCGAGAMGEAAVSATEVGIIQKAAAFRAIFATEGPHRERLPLRLIAPHPGDRGGRYPQEKRVRELAVKIIAAGFSQAEADHEGVCVQEYSTEQIYKKKQANPHFQTYSDYNRDNAQGFLTECFNRSCGADVAYGKNRTLTCASCCGQS